MKKTMFITSVIMVVVMAIALTTSSLAWFSAGGNDYVTTQSFKVTATAGTSTGIAISKDGTTWDNNIILTSTGNTGLNPLVPFAKKASDITAADLLAALVGGKEAKYMTEAMYDADVVAYTDGDEGTTASYADVYAAFEAAAADSENPEYGSDLSYANLVSFGYVSADTIGTTAAAGTDYSAYMIGNKFDNNGKFTNDLYRNGFYTDTFYITNLATGAGALSINLDTTINFSFDTYVNTGSQENPVWAVEDTMTYDREHRGAAKYDTDATLCVAVLAKVSEFDTEMIEYLDTHDAASDGWEIIAYADSKGGTAINMGRASANFAQGAAVSSCGTTIATTGLNKTNTEALRPERLYTLSEADLTAANNALNPTEAYTLKEGDAAGDGVTISADVKTIKVVAWYDSTLVNNNAADADLKFDLKFAIHTGS